MEIQNAAIVIACVAFLITQTHLWLTARKLLKKSDQSWARVDATINATLAELKKDLFDDKTAVRLWNWFLTAEIKTDKKIKDEDGNETGVFVTTTPYEQLVSNTATVFLRKARSAKGGVIAGAGAAIEAMGGMPVRQKNQSTVDYYTELLAARLAPVIDERITKILTKDSGPQQSDY